MSCHFDSLSISLDLFFYYCLVSGSSGSLVFLVSCACSLSFVLLKYFVSASMDLYHDTISIFHYFLITFYCDDKQKGLTKWNHAVDLSFFFLIKYDVTSTVLLACFNYFLYNCHDTILFLMPINIIYCVNIG